MAEIQLPPCPHLGLKLTQQQLVRLHAIMRNFAIDAVLLNTAKSGEGERRQPFNLEAAKRGEPLVTRDGRSAKFVAYVPEAEKYSVAAFVQGASGVDTFADNGRYYAESREDSEHDLFMAPKPKRTVWVNFYQDRTMVDGLGAGVFARRSSALKFEGHEQAIAIAVPVQIDA